MVSQKCDQGGAISDQGDVVSGLTHPMFFVGPMSKNVVDALASLSHELSTHIGVLSSQQQVDFSGRYSNNWTTQGLRKYLVSTGANKLLLQRAHGGPGTDAACDDGMESFEEDLQ